MKLNEVSLNIDTLVVTKVDPKVASIVFSEVLVIERIEIFPDKTDPKLVDKIYNLNARKPNVKNNEEKGVKKVS